MRRASMLLGAGCLLAMLLAGFHPVLFGGRRFAYRDAGQFYDPLDRVVRQEWASGRLPLWNPWQNAGTPLLGMPMAAVLYPGKILHAVLPDSHAAGAYVVAHVLIALAGMVAMGRTLGLGGNASMISAMAYAFGAPVLSMSSNVIFLVGAAWAPWGFRAILRLGGPHHRWALVELSAVLALQVLGGDPEAAYWTGASGVLYAAILALGREGHSFRVARGLSGAGLLAAMLAAVQIGPSWDQARHSTRMDPLSTIYDFSVEPYRLAEVVWPHVFGLEVPLNASWLPALPPAGERMTWAPSLYLGGFVVVLAIVGAGVRGAPAWRRWLSILALIGLVAGLGKFAGPLWWARQVPWLADRLGPPDPPAGIPRSDGYLPDGAGSLYSLLTLLPGFAMFRYPAKLIVLAALAGAVLAGQGWDLLGRGVAPSRRARRWCLFGLTASVGLGLVVMAIRGPFERWITSRVPPGSLYGPVDAAGAVDQTLRAMIQGGAVYAAGAVLVTLAAARPGWAGAGALVLVAADLAMAGSRIVWTIPQSVFDSTPRIARLIEEAEHVDPSPGPFRIHRVEQWHPDQYFRRRSPDRLAELTRWERDTLDRLHAEPFGLAYTVIRGVLDIGDYLEFFEARATLAPDDRGVKRPIYTFPRGGFDLWNARYFVMPVGLNGWMGPERGFTRLAPTDEVVGDPGRSRDWIEREGWQLLRNDRALPRCWAVASAMVVPPTTPGSPSRSGMIRSLVDPGGAGGFDPRRMAFVEADDPTPMKVLDRPPPAGPIGSVAIVSYDPRRVEIRADLREPGLVILSDTFDPDWQLAIDGRPAPVWRTNRLMRGALVSAGRHTLVYTDRPGAFRIGAVVSAAGLLVVGGLALRAAWAGRVRGPEGPRTARPDGVRGG